MLGLYDAIRTAPLQFPGAPKISPPLRDLLQRMLVKDPSQRLGLQDIMDHPWAQSQGLPNLCSLQVRLARPQSCAEVQLLVLCKIPGTGMVWHPVCKLVESLEPGSGEVLVTVEATGESQHFW